MTHAHSQPSKFFASDIVLYNDAELDQYLESNGRSEFDEAFLVAIMLRLNDRCIQVEDPENLPDHFIQRLRLLSRLIVVSFSFFNNTVPGSEQMRAIQHPPVRLI